MADTDVLLACTTSLAAVVGLTQARAAVARRPEGSAPLVICDLGLPRNVDPAVAELSGVVLVDLQTLQDHRQRATDLRELDAARHIVATEVARHSARHRSAAAAPATGTEHATPVGAGVTTNLIWGLVNLAIGIALTTPRVARRAYVPFTIGAAAGALGLAISLIITRS